MALEGKYRPPDRSKYLLADEIERLLKAAAGTGEFERLFLTFMANTGVRPSESNIVKASDVHASESRVRIKTLKQKERKGSSKEIFRDVDLAPDYAKELGTLARSKGPSAILFPRSRQALWGIFKRTAVKAGLPDTYTLYSLRHSRCIYLLEWTKDLLYTSRQMGHSSVDVTSVYWHCTPSKRNDYVNSKFASFGVKKSTPGKPPANPKE